jgi:hypothetical protein
MQSGTDVQQWNRELKKGKNRPFSMARRQPRGPTAQRNITLPLHVWKMLDVAADLQSESYVLMGGKTKFAVSDLLESGAKMYLRSLIRDVGPLPEDASARKSFVKRLADVNQKELLQDLLEDAKSS